MTVIAKADQRLDCTGLLCPEPVIRTAERVGEMRPGQVLEVVGDDPGMQIDLPAWCLSHEHQFLGVEVREGRTICYLRVVSLV
jgi:tRNA 2-thiouridine synthesizing protein A